MDNPPKEALTADQLHELAIGRLGRRESSEAMLKEYLLRKKAPADLVDQEIRKLVELGYLSNARFTRMFVREYLLRKKGAAWIKRALKQRGIDCGEKELRELIDELDPQAEHHGMVALIERKYPGWQSDFKCKQKATRALLSRGYSFSQIQKLFRELSGGLSV